jgi:hypothetical protein
MRRIAYERGSYWASTSSRFKGYEVWKVNGNCSTRCASIGYSGREGMRRVIAEIDRRIALDEVER